MGRPCAPPVLSFQTPAVNVLFASAEVSPFAKVGGLADVAGSLPVALRALGHDARIVMPAYRMVLDDPRWSTRDIARFTVEVGPGWTEEAVAYASSIEDVPVILVGGDRWFQDAVSSETVYTPGAEQYLFFARAALEATKALGWKPDVVHANDWHMAFLPLLMREGGDRTWDDVGAVFTIHNLAYQGCFGPELLDQLGLPQRLFNMHQTEAWGALNFLKTGCVFSDQVNTVSPRYAHEIQTPEFGCGLDGVMRMLHDHRALHGILNGLDTGRFDPSQDPALVRNFSADDRSGKAECRAALMRELGLPEIEGCPVAGVVSRLSEQKGMDLMLHAADALAAVPIQLVVLGVGDPWLAGEFQALQERLPNHVRFVERFDLDLAQRIYAGCDLFLMPSRYEPCGLGQLIALRYGTLPVVRETGGLADTVWEGVNGFSFLPQTEDAFLGAVRRAREAFCDPVRWQAMQTTAMSGDYGWVRSAGEYVALYGRAIARRQPVLTA